MKNFFEKFQNRFGEGTAFDLDYGKLIILLLLVIWLFLRTIESRARLCRAAKRVGII